QPHPRRSISPRLRLGSPMPSLARYDSAMRLAVNSVALWAVLFTALAPLAARAQMVDIKLHNQVPSGQKPSLTLRPTAGVARLRVEVVRQEDGKRFVVEHGPLGAGESATLAVGDGRGGRAHWSGTLVASYPDGNRQTYQLTFESAVVGELKV